MKQKIRSWLGRRSGRRMVWSAVRSQRPGSVEPLEGRVFLHAGPHIIDAVADNRGFVELRVDKALDASTVSRRSVQLYTAGPDGIFKTADDVRETIKVRYASRRIYIESDLPAYTSFQVVVRGSRIADKDGNLLDGEFNGANAVSGNGTEGGNYKFLARKWSSKVIARYTTVAGVMDVELHKKDTPLTVRNFLKYANRGRWDGTVFHRSMPGFVIQGGGFKVEDDLDVRRVKQYDPVPNEFKFSNVRGTIAMAKIGGDPNSATNQWFFNLGDNSTNLDSQNGGFTVFGRITKSSGLRVMDRIASYDRVSYLYDNANWASVFQNTPVRDAGRLQTSPREPSRDLIIVHRVALQMKIVKA